MASQIYPLHAGMSIYIGVISLHRGKLMSVRLLINKCKFRIQILNRVYAKGVVIYYIRKITENSRHL